MMKDRVQFNARFNLAQIKLTYVYRRGETHDPPDGCTQTPDQVRPMDGSRPAAAGWGRTSFAILFICLCFCSISAWVIFDARQAAWKHAGVVGSTIAAAVAADIASNIDALHLSIIGVIENLTLPEIEDVPLAERHLLLFDRSVTARHLSAIIVVNEHGRLRYDFEDDRTIDGRPLGPRLFQGSQAQ